MDIPAFHLDFMGNRLLIAIIAILHVLINHSLAVGLIPLVVLLERLGYKLQNPDWDELARKIMFFAFIVTTSLGAMTGVGIWLSASLANPYSIGSLIRVFYWAWFTEWIVFVTEVVLILIYFLSWRRSNLNRAAKAKAY
jgi:cytochrome bd-type quinol oxidase subunit 1